MTTAASSAAVSATLGQWLAAFSTEASFTEARQVGAALIREIPRGQLSDGAIRLIEEGSMAERLAALQAHEELRGLLEPHLGRSLTDFLRQPSAPSTALTVSRTTPWAEGASSIGGYLGRRVAKGVGASILFTTTTEATSHPFSQDRLQTGFRFERLDPTPDNDERRTAHRKAHAERLQWARNHSKQWIETLSGDGAASYRRTEDAILRINREAREIFLAAEAKWATTPAEDIHERNLQIARGSMVRWHQLKRLVYEAETAERDWQLNAYQDLMLPARNSEKHWRRYSEARADFEGKMGAYLAYAERMLHDDPETREHGRKRLEQKAFMALWVLHDTVREIAQDLNLPAKDLAAPLTFTWKMQAYLISRGPNEMRGLGPLVETTWNLAPFVRDAKTGRISGRILDEKVARHWALPLLAEHYRSMRIAGPEEPLYFQDHNPDEAALIPGGIFLFQNRGGISGRGLISHWPHTGSIDYAGVYGAAHLLGLPAPSIVAEQVFNYVPIFRGVLRKRGVFLSRSGDPRKRRKLYDDMAARLEEGMMLSLFGTGTRSVGWPLASPFADLNEPGILHLPGEFIPSRDMTGMAVKLSWQTERPIAVFTANLSRGGVPEPSIPRDLAGFFGGRNMFHFARPGEEDGFIALAGILSASSLLRPDEMAERDEWSALQANIALIREMEWLTGARMDAGPRRVN